MTAPFPQPVKLGGSATNRFRLSDVEAYEAVQRGEDPPPRRQVDELFLTTRQLARRWNISMPTMWRWLSHARQQANDAA